MDELPNFYNSTCKKCNLEVFDRVRLDLNACPKCSALDWTPHKVIPFSEVPQHILKAKFEREINIYKDRSTSDEFDPL